MGKCWSRLRDAKLAVCPVFSFNSINILKDILDSDFIIIQENGCTERFPVSEYILDYMKRDNRPNSQIKLVEDYCNKGE